MENLNKENLINFIYQTFINENIKTPKNALKEVDEYVKNEFDCSDTVENFFYELQGEFNLGFDVELDKDYEYVISVYKTVNIKDKNYTQKTILDYLKNLYIDDVDSLLDFLITKDTESTNLFTN